MTAREHLSALREAGAAVFDPPGIRFVETLLDRAETLDGAAAERLLSRAAARLNDLEAAWQKARAEVRGLLEEATALGLDPDGALARDLARGDLQAVREEAGRRMRQLRSGRGEVARTRVTRLAEQLARRGITVPPEVADAVRRAADAPPVDSAAEREARALGDRLADVLFREAADHARAALVVARARDRLPETVGPYNPAALAADALALVESISPALLRTWVTGLEDLAALRPPPDERARPRPRRRR